MSSDDSDTDGRTANLLAALALVSTDGMRAAVGRELSSAAVLAALASFADGASIDSLRRMVGLSHSGGVRVVSGLEQAGLVRRKRDQADRRAVHVRLTARGRREAGRVLRARRTAAGALLAPLAHSDRDTLATLLETLLAGVATADTATRICRLCEPDVCGHPARCPVTLAARAERGQPA